MYPHVFCVYHLRQPCCQTEWSPPFRRLPEINQNHKLKVEFSILVGQLLFMLIQGEEPWDGNCKDRLGGSTVQKPRSFMSQRRSNVKSSNYIDTPGERTQHKSIVIQPSNQCIKSTTSSVILGEQLRTINP